MSQALRQFKFAAVQMAVGADKAANVARATRLVAQAARAGAHVVALPECFNCPYGNEYFGEYAETVPDGPTTAALRAAAREHGVLLIGGSQPERAAGSGRLYNTCVVCDEQGCVAHALRVAWQPHAHAWPRAAHGAPRSELLQTFRKLHLFDIDIPGGITFQESKTLSAGDRVAVVDSPRFGRIGIGICYDVRFPTLARIMAQRGATLLCYPGAFNTTTGPLHWQLLARARAVDNQLYVAMVSPARDETAKYHAYGHSIVVDPWAKVLTEAGEAEDVVYADIDLDALDQVRQNIPVRDQQRDDLYATVDKTA